VPGGHGQFNDSGWLGGGVDADTDEERRSWIVDRDCSGPVSADLCGPKVDQWGCHDHGMTILGAFVLVPSWNML